MKPQRKPGIYPLRNGCQPLRLLFQPYMRRAAARLRDAAEQRLYRHHLFLTAQDARRTGYSFYSFVKEHDRRRSGNCVRLYPEVHG